MKNRTVGLIVLSFSILIGFIIYIFNQALNRIVNDSCSHGPTCPMWGTIDAQTRIGIALMAMVIGLGLYLVFFAKDEKIERKEPKKITKDEYSIILAKLDDDEKVIMGKIIENEGTAFQSTLIKDTGFSKVKITRILDRLEGMSLIERKRRGMTNIVILKND